mmetsp:Transcript_4649/g.11476  ORF Transcript_4649/g.11476 Transcript_4649/m.11476 type:complete len:138 (-) Transcript_4649:219-632(-)
MKQALPNTQYAIKAAASVQVGLRMPAIVSLIYNKGKKGRTHRAVPAAGHEMGACHSKSASPLLLLRTPATITWSDAQLHITSPPTAAAHMRQEEVSRGVQLRGCKPGVRHQHPTHMSTACLHAPAGQDAMHSHPMRS